MNQSNNNPEVSSPLIDEYTNRLLELTSTAYRTEEEIDEIIHIVQNWIDLPSLLDGLPYANKKGIARELYLKCYNYDEAIFLQNDVPDAYYTVVSGAVSIYSNSNLKQDEKINISEALKSGDEGDDSYREQFGRFLVQITSGAR